jgi:Sulfotransferase family
VHTPSPCTTIKQVVNLIALKNPDGPVQVEMCLPRPGQAYDGWYFPISGLVRLRNPTDRLVSVEIRSDDYAVDTFTPEQARQKPADVKASGFATLVDSLASAISPRDGSLTFQGMVNTFGLSPHCRFFADALMESGARHRLCRIEADCVIPTPPPSDFSPLLLNALPRSGTTWLIDLLAGHPSIVTDPIYPYEVRPTVYWAHMLRVLTQPYNNAAERNELFIGNSHSIGGSPYFSPALEHLIPWHTTAYPEELLNTVRRLTKDFYGRLQREHGKKTPAFIVEKFPGKKPPLTMRWLFPKVREIMLIRHPRAVMQSIFSFNEQRGYKDFGEETHGRTEALFAYVSRQLQDYLYSYNTRCDDRSGIVVRYEDLAADTPATLKSILDICELDTSPPVVREMIARSERRRVAEHITSGSAHKSKTSLTGEENQWIAKHFAGVLEKFYPGDRAT